MKILYLDTSSSFLYAGITEGNRLIDEIKEKLDKDLSTYALLKIEALFKKNNIMPDDIGRIIVVNGPGSFTGIRIGLTIAKIYAWSLKKEIVTISSLESMALSLDAIYDYIIPCIDARRENVYAGIFDSKMNLVMKEQHISLNALLTAVDNLPGKVLFISNDELPNTKYEVHKYEPSILKIVNNCANKKILNPHEIDAYYLKLTEAEENKQ